jgi:hypothetical protein
MSHVQLLLFSALVTERFFRRRAATTVVTSGAKSDSCLPYNHKLVQKKSDSPSPRVFWMDALKRATVLASLLAGNAAQGQC